MGARATRRLLVLVAAAAFGGCVRPVYLVPAPGSLPAEGRRRAAVQEVEGVKVIVDATAWSGLQLVLENLTPVQVDIANRAGRPLRIRYDGFRLVAAGGKLTAMAPAQAVGPLGAPGFNWTVPAIDQLHSRALAETVLGEGEHASGFVYFPLLNRSWHQVVFEADLVNAGTGEKFGTVSIPFSSVSSLD